MKIVVLGRAGSGKTVLSKEICKVLEFPLVETSDLVKAASGGSERAELNVQKEKFEKRNPDWLWNRMRDAIASKGEGREKSCVVSGIREPYLLHKLIDTSLDEVYVVGLEVSDFNRYARLCARDGHISVQNFRAIDNGTLEEDGILGDNTLGLDITLTRCNFIIDGNRSVAEVLKEARKILHGLRRPAVR